MADGQSYRNETIDSLCRIREEDNKRWSRLTQGLISLPKFDSEWEVLLESLDKISGGEIKKYHRSLLAASASFQQYTKGTISSREVSKHVDVADSHIRQGWGLLDRIAQIKKAVQGDDITPNVLSDWVYTGLNLTKVYEFAGGFTDLKDNKLISKAFLEEMPKLVNSNPPALKELENVKKRIKIKILK